MKNLSLTITFSIALSLFSVAQSRLEPDTISMNDSTEYELLIFDSGFDVWLNSKAKPMEFYSQQYYELWNSRYVTEWNLRYTAGKNMNEIESYIDYSTSNDYGLELNYTLYNYFLYFEETNNIVLVHRKGK